MARPEPRTRVGRASLMKRRRSTVAVSVLIACTLIIGVSVWFVASHDGGEVSSAEVVSTSVSDTETLEASSSAEAATTSVETETAEAEAAEPEPDPEPDDDEVSEPAVVTSQPSESFHGASFGGATQVIVVTADSMTTTRATLTTYQESDGTWSTVMSTAACVGKRGLVLDAERIEGQLQTPIGVYSLPYAFGTAANPNTGGTSLEYKPVGSNTYYDGNYGSPTFNDLVEGVPTAGDNYEYMYLTTAYKYGIDTGFNLEQKVGKGNAIFIHCNTGSGYTAGCVSISETKMVELLRWLDRTQDPVVLICLTSDLDSYYY